jgi:hypothetical protein
MVGRSHGFAHKGRQPNEAVGRGRRRPSRRLGQAAARGTYQDLFVTTGTSFKESVQMACARYRQIGDYSLPGRTSFKGRLSRPVEWLCIGDYRLPVRTSFKERGTGTNVLRSHQMGDYRLLTETSEKHNGARLLRAPSLRRYPSCVNNGSSIEESPRTCCTTSKPCLRDGWETRARVIPGVRQI